MSADPRSFPIRAKHNGTMSVGIFQVTPPSRSIRLSAGVTYEVECKLGSDRGNIGQRWYRDGAPVVLRTTATECGAETDVFYHVNANRWILNLCTFAPSLSGSYTCVLSPDINKTLDISEGELTTIRDRS